MLEFIKMFGLGVLYTILSPILLVVFALFVVYVFFNYLVLETINFFGFFFGYTFSSKTKLEEALEKQKENENFDDVNRGLSNNDVVSGLVIEDLRGREDDEQLY